MTNSRAKGCRGEREFRDVLRAHGYTAIRGQQHSGGSGSPDVIHDIPGVHFEVKRKEAGNPYDWLKQATEDAGTVSPAEIAGPSLVPVVAHKRNHKQWIVILSAEDFLTILKQRL